MSINLFQLLGFFLVNFFIIDSFKILPYSSVITIIQSRNLIYRIFNFDMYSLVIKIATLVNKAVLIEIIIPAPGKIKHIVELPIALPVPTSYSVKFNNTLFSFKAFYFFL